MLGLYLILGHLIGDFALQTGAIARRKSISIWGLVIHVGIVTVVTGSLLIGRVPDWLDVTLAVGAIHFGIDSVRTFLIRDLPPGKSLLYLLGDQTAHIAALLLIAYFVAGETPAQIWATLQKPTLTGYGWPVLLGFFVFLVWTVAVVEQETARMINPSLGEAGQFLWIDPIERLAGAGERLLTVSLILSTQFLFIPLVYLPRLLLQLTRPLSRNEFWIIGTRTGVSFGSAGFVGYLLLCIV